jgi:hypothetical protein
MQKSSATSLFHKGTIESSDWNYLVREKRFNGKNQK